MSVGWVGESACVTVLYEIEVDEEVVAAANHVGQQPVVLIAGFFIEDQRDGGAFGKQGLEIGARLGAVALIGPIPCHRFGCVDTDQAHGFT